MEHTESLEVQVSTSSESAAFAEFCADSARVDRVMANIYARGDRTMSALIALHVVISLALASFYNTWLATLLIAGAAGGMFFVGVSLMPRHRVTRVVAGISLQTFVALHIWQLHGLPEMHFFFFTAFTAMVVYEDALSMWPGTILIILQHILFAIMQNSGVSVFFFPDAFVTFTKLFFHFGIAILHVATCGFWAVFLRKQALFDAFQRERIEQKSVQLARALTELEESQEARSRAEKLAAIGQLAASVGHELRNPIAAVRNASTYLTRRLTDPKFANQPAANDPRVPQFLEVMRKELDASSKIISDLLDFAREQKPQRSPCPLRPLVDDVFSIVPTREGVTLANEVPENLPVPNLDKDQFRQVLMNLVQNAIEAVAERPKGEVRVRAEQCEDGSLRIVVADNGHGIEPDVLQKIFQPLYTTKVKGTGLGLAVVSSTIASHNATIEAMSDVGKGTAFTILLPRDAHYGDTSSALAS